MPDLKPPHHRPRRKTAALLAALALAMGGYVGWLWLSGGKAQTTPAHPSTAVPVTIAEAQKQDFPVYLNGLGTVQPFDTVTVRSRVDGAVIKVAFAEGQMVKEGDLLVQIDPRPFQAVLDQARAKKAQDEATLKNAQLDLERYANLAKESFGSRQQYDTQQALVEQLTAQIQGDQAAIESAQTQFDYTTIRSPLTGRAGFRLVDPGNIVHATDTAGIVTIVKLQPISVVFTAPEGELPRIRSAMAAGGAPVEALTTDGGASLGKGALLLVNNQIDPASGTISMKATFPNADETLWPGLSVSTRTQIDTLKQVVVVPDTAVQRGPNGAYVFIVGTDNKAEARAVAVGPEGDGRAVITNAINPGEKVVTEGQYRLAPGVLVQATPASPDNEMAQNQPAGRK